MQKISLQRTGMADPLNFEGVLEKFQHALEFRGSRPQAHMQDPVESTWGTDANAGVLAYPHWQPV